MIGKAAGCQGSLEFFVQGETFFTNSLFLTIKSALTEAKLHL